MKSTPGISEINSRTLKRPTPGHVCHEYGFLSFPCPYPQSNHLGLPVQWPGEQHSLRCSTIACPHSNHWGFQSIHLRLNVHYELTKRIHNHWVGNVNVELGGFGGLSNNMLIFGNSHVEKRQRSNNVWATPTSTQDIGMLTRLKRVTGIWWKMGKKLPDLLLQPSVVLWGEIWLAIAMHQLGRFGALFLGQSTPSWCKHKLHSVNSSGGMGYQRTLGSKWPLEI